MVSFGQLALKKIKILQFYKIEEITAKNNALVILIETHETPFFAPI